MGFSLNFKNVGHFFATGFKYVAVGVKDVVLVANKSQAVAPEVEKFIGALAGPVATKATDLAFHVLGEVASTLDKLGPDLSKLTVDPSGKSALSLSLDAQVVADIKTAAAQIEAIIKAVGGAKPIV